MNGRDTPGSPRHTGPASGTSHVSLVYNYHIRVLHAPLACPEPRILPANLCHRRPITRSITYPLSPAAILRRCLTASRPFPCQTTTRYHTSVQLHLFTSCSMYLSVSRIQTDIPERYAPLVKVPVMHSSPGMAGEDARSHEYRHKWHLMIVEETLVFKL